MTITTDGYAVLNEGGTFVDLARIASDLGVSEVKVKEVLGDCDTDWIMDEIVDVATRALGEEVESHLPTPVAK